MTEYIEKKRATKLGLMVRKDGHGEYLLTNENNALAAPGPMTLEQLSLWLDDLEGELEW